jgi:hypothetical protein
MFVQKILQVNLSILSLDIDKKLVQLPRETPLGPIVRGRPIFSHAGHAEKIPAHQQGDATERAL